MPINNIQFRAEIGLFNNAFQCVLIKHSSLLAWIINNFSVKIEKIDSNNIFPSCCHLLSFLFILFITPLIVLFTLVFPKANNLHTVFIVSYMYIYICFRFMLNLLWFTISCRKFVAKLMVRYCFFFQICTLVPFIRLALIISGDIEVNPGPKNMNNKNFSLCHWNLNGIAANNYVKISLLEAYTAVHDFDVICVSETFLDSDYSNDDTRLSLQGYTMIRSDHPSNTKRGGVCIYYKEHLPFIRRNDINALDECIVGEIRVDNSKCFITCVYRSPSQTEDETNNFLSKFDQMCCSIARESPVCSIAIGDFNAKSTNWWTEGTNNQCGLELQNIMTMLGYSQIINEPTNFEPNKSSTCIDLIFTNQTNLVVESGTHPSLYNTCHHQIIYAKISFMINLPPPYEREIWHYNRAQVELIKRSIMNFDWNRALANHSINDQVEIFNNTLLNIFRNFIPHETIKCNYRDPPWMNKNIKSALRYKNTLYRKYTYGGKKQQDLINLNETTILVSNLITETKSSYFTSLGNKLNNPLTGPKTYWSILKRFMNKAKLPTVPPLLVNGSFETDFIKKAGIFNVFFADQCTIFNNGSTLPDIRYKTNERKMDIFFSFSDLSKIIKNLNPNKAHGHDNISIKMIQICGDSIISPLKLLFESAIRSGHFPDSWKKGNIIPVHKKESKNLLKNYRPISLLPIFGKIFEKVIYNNLFEFFQENNFLSQNQSGFRSGDSCTSQLISITHSIYQSFDVNPSLETRGVFLDISKAFDKVWHEGLLFKLKCYGIDGDLYNILKNYLFNRKQRVILCGQSSNWLDVNAGVPQGSVLGPLLFLIYINDLPENFICEPKLFADDTSIFSTVFDITKSGEDLNQDLTTVTNWAFQWKMSFNPDPNKQAAEVIFSRKKKPHSHPSLYFNDSPVTSLPSQKHLGLILDKKLIFDQHLKEKISKANKGIGLIKRLHAYLPRKSLLTIYFSFVRPHLDYCDIIYDQPNNDTFCSMIESVQYNAALAITGTIRGSSRERLYQELGLESLSDRRWYRRLVYFFNIVTGKAPDYLCSILPSKQCSFDPKRRNLFRTFTTHTDYFKNSFVPYCISEWNKLGSSLQNSKSVSSFKKSLLIFIRPKMCSVYNVHDPQGLKLLMRLRVNLSHLREHKFRHNFLDTINPLCSCSLEIESTGHYLLRCPFYTRIRKTLFDNIIVILGPISNLSDDRLVNLLLYGNNIYSVEENASVLKNTITFLKSSERFDGPLF